MKKLVGTLLLACSLIAAAGPAALAVLSAPVAAALPLGFGLVGAVPLTWLQLRLRRRLAGSVRRGRLARGHPGRGRPGPG